MKAMSAYGKVVKEDRKLPDSLVWPKETTGLQLHGGRMELGEEGQPKP